MKYLLLIIVLLLSANTKSQDTRVPVDSVVVTSNSVVIKGKEIKYKAQTGTQPVFDEQGNIKATLFYTYYYRTDVKQVEKRPIIMSFNGGPGSASVWMHLAYTGPKILKIDNEGNPIQPYGIKDNSSSVLDLADIVFINPVNTAYSRPVVEKDEKFDPKYFFGVNADAKYLANWLNTFITRNNRWQSPKYIIGESYGGTRAMQLAYELQNNQWMYLNGVIMVSPADYSLIRTNSSENYAINFPYFTATAWYHNKLAPALQQQDILDILPESESFAINKLLPALAKGGFISERQKQRIAEKMAYYSGLDKKVILQHNLEVPNSFFWKELLRNSNGKTLGRLDSRYLGIDRKESGSRPDYNPELVSWLHSFAPAINYYVKNILKFKTDVKYNIFGFVHPWNYQNNNARENLRKAMAQNPYLKVMVQSGYYDGATTYSAAKYTLSKIDPSGKLKHRLFFKAYRSGHMMYLRKEDLEKANEDLRTFIKQSSGDIGSAKY
ncbi:MAG: S10 family peptidase [Tenacibaculum sp.]